MPFGGVIDFGNLIAMFNNEMTNYYSVYVPSHPALATTFFASLSRLVIRQGPLSSVQVGSVTIV